MSSIFKCSTKLTYYSCRTQHKFCWKAKGKRGFIISIVGFWVWFFIHCNCRQMKIWQHMPINNVSSTSDTVMLPNTCFRGLYFLPTTSCILLVIGMSYWHDWLILIFHNASSSILVTSLNLGSSSSNWTTFAWFYWWYVGCHPLMQNLQCESYLR